MVPTELRRKSFGLDLNYILNIHFLLNNLIKSEYILIIQRTRGP